MLMQNTYVGTGEQGLPDFPDIKWYSEHVRKSQYLLQIVKCRNTECCRPRSGLFRLLDNMFLPPPIKVKQTVDDLVLDEGGQFLNLPDNLALRLSASLKDFLQMPYDYFCPTAPSKVATKAGRSMKSTAWLALELAANKGNVTLRKTTGCCSRISFAAKSGERKIQERVTYVEIDDEMAGAFKIHQYRPKHDEPSNFNF
ncbi:unnamed protein product [Acanthoscelides obtectus]|uniref:Uncharacterized protein n=1 Tax=Acanthoscelides obtectus TaxID=200917 RepID=A0A9P0K5Y4_ACAOB|nr:unnamed protein product [Acanthoscelides obtectus]CAK1626836.1 hypothetical protein AOBTE_LOCUS4104 [Acanthoscelides obtectus]